MKSFNHENASPEMIKDIFDGAAIDSEFDDDGDLYVTGGVDFPFWATLVPDHNLVQFKTHVRVKKEASDEDVLSLVNRANSRIMLPQFFMVSDEEGRVIQGVYYLAYEYGIDSRLVIKIARRFPSAFKACGEIDEDNVIP
ncbi:MAG: YbjN domain-containing protein [Gammaproteobacteria bacterium]